MTRAARRPATSDPDAIRARLGTLVDADARTRAQIAGAAGMAPPNLSRMLGPGPPDPLVSTVGRLLAALGLPWSALDG